MESLTTPIPHLPPASDAPSSPPIRLVEAISAVKDVANIGITDDAVPSGVQTYCAGLFRDPALSIDISEVETRDDDATIPDDSTVTTSDAAVFSIESKSNTGDTIATDETDVQPDTRVDLDGAKAVLTNSDGQNKASLLGVGQEAEQAVNEQIASPAEPTDDSAGDPPLLPPTQAPSGFMEGNQSPDPIKALNEVRKSDHRVRGAILDSSNFTEEPYNATGLGRSGDSDYRPQDLSLDQDLHATVESILVAMLKSGRLHAGLVRRSSQSCSTQDQSDNQPEDDLKIRLGQNTPTGLKLRRWSTQRPLRWYFDELSFPSDNDAVFVKEQLDRAFKCWTDPGFGLEVRETRFKDDATFFVRWSEDNDEDNRRDLAIAFFPGASRHQSNIFIFDKALRGYPRAFLFGVLCHELGHVWGLRHEFDERTAGLYGQPNSKSVMNYYHNSDMANLMVHPADLDGLRAFYAYKGSHLSVRVDGKLKQVEIVDVLPRAQQPNFLSLRQRKRLAPGDRHVSTWPGSW